ncbi:Peptidoglycan/LPS O-acetylase OafA/YrhL, contains acyltransferase and SGNH-hydrolase domains [Enhydrobacter aerosaccus]|uniref:Peptidoglycan/LPS O-acetylase OafA/YrhL, contains acyltransferase and SGNH-hydrolase domains n=1 Tax=Enhydrobacter aerosaccus TaxID=225324 RepID=A0A1T4N5D1_9HYPH|nr:acyltransferase [Enhydrobacter aerosaccus]SJZ74570.1 Peptidoglycan/LPS O-acetylase OafA/YrhL, contains acyltransferase and SGNH-hydrolase domains [Enhydrobacter aerosaccus]
MATAKARIHGLDMLRGGAAAAVMVHHHAQYYDVLYPGRVPLAIDLGAGHFGVELFFIISGFVILMSLEAKKSVRAFAVSRAGRLLPTFLVTLILATAILTVSPMPPLETPTALQFLANLTMAPSLFNQSPIDLPYWTLTYELLFYIYMAFVLYFGALRQTERLGLLLMAMGCLYWALADIEHHRRTSILLMVHYSSFFVIGMCLYRIHMRAARPITYTALVAALATTAFGGGEQAFYAPGSVYLPLTLAFTALVWLATSHGSKWPVWRPFLFLGQISYPLYLVHVVLGFEIIRFGTNHGWSTLDGVMAAGLASFVAATVLHYAVELPGMRWSRSLLVRARPVALTDSLFQSGQPSSPSVTDASRSGETRPEF